MVSGSMVGANDTEMLLMLSGGKSREEEEEEGSIVLDGSSAIEHDWVRASFSVSVWSWRPWEYTIAEGLVIVINFVSLWGKGVRESLRFGFFRCVLESHYYDMDGRLGFTVTTLRGEYWCESFKSHRAAMTPCCELWHALTNEWEALVHFLSVHHTTSFNRDCT